MKLKELFVIADRLGAKLVATGHYARIAKSPEGEPCLLRGEDPDKDQSYFLYASPREELERLVFPLGASKKGEVRSAAVELALPGAKKGESQELCFVGQGAHAYAGFVEERAKGRVRPGPILDSDGSEVGRHNGIHHFTIGQRKGLGVALGSPRFVTDIDASTGAVRLGKEDALERHSVLVEAVVLAPGVTLPFRAQTKIRYRHEGAVGIVEPAEDPTTARITFDGPVRAITRGQIAVFYDGDRVLGGGRLAPKASTKDTKDATMSAEP